MSSLDLKTDKDALTAPPGRPPSVDAVLNDPGQQVNLATWGRPMVREAVRRIQAEVRRAGQRPPWSERSDGYATAVAELLMRTAGSPPRRVVNLTGTLIHTNLGRAPLPEAAAASMARLATGATNLEFDLALGRRGKRESFVAAALCALTGAEAATVVNNGAAGLLLILNTLALGQRVPVSRGELIEIGGSFRLPEIMTRAGCTLAEVGSTNRTHRHDYERAIEDGCALLLKVHPSNYRVSGFTASVPLHALADLAHEHALPVVEDLGSGALIDYARFGLPHEPTPMDSLAAGADLVLFSGDKLLGGPQAGIVLGRRELIAELDRNPLKRALRLDRTALAALAETLAIYADPARVEREIPVVRWAARGLDEIRAVAAQLADALRGALGSECAVEVVESRAEIGSGALPEVTLPSVAVRLTPSASAGALLARLRGLEPPIIGRIADRAVWLDCRALEDPAAAIAAISGLTRP